MAEWLKAHAWKACIPQGIQGSNPCLSAKLLQNHLYTESKAFRHRVKLGIEAYGDPFKPKEKSEWDLLDELD
jgi:hypothetical protein